MPLGGRARTDWETAWDAALTALELDADLAERMLGHDHLPATPDPWTVPTGLGPLPAALAERARALLNRQVEVSRRVAEAAVLARRHGQVAQAMRSVPPAAPVYLDTPC